MARAIDACNLKKCVMESIGKYHDYEKRMIYEDIDNQPTIEPKQEWISVEDRPPKEHGEYIIHVENLTGFHALDRNVFEATYAFGQWIFDGCSDNRVTHWMPLPEPPKKE